jgi:hypothetical protein
MKIPKHAMHRHHGHYVGFDVEGSIDDLRNCLGSLKSGEIPEVMDIDVKGQRRCIVYFEAGTPYRDLAVAQYKLNSHPKLKTHLGFFIPSYVGWRWLVKNMGSKFILCNLPDIVMHFLRGHFLIGNQGLTRGESVFLAVIHILFVGVLFCYMSGLATESKLISFFAGCLLWHTLSCTLAASLPKVGNVNTYGSTDDGEWQPLLSVLFGIALFMAYIWLDVTWQWTTLGVLACWLLYRAYAKISPADYSI